MAPSHNQSLFSEPCIKKAQTEVLSPVGQREILKPPKDNPYNVEKVTPRGTTK